MKNSVEFEWCADFLARMIEKYWNEVELPSTTQNDENTEDDTDDSDDRQIDSPMSLVCA